MMVRIALDAGHGKYTAGKRTPDDEREWTFNDKVLRACVAKLNEFQNVEVLRLDDPTGATDVPLKARTDRANNWKADVLVSIHHNANAGKWGSHGGVETYVQKKTASKASKDIATLIQPRIVKAMGLRDRGVKTQNLHMTRESRMPAVLTEGGFMDSTIDIHSMRDDGNLKAQGEAIADALAVYFKLVKKQGASTQKEDDDLKFTSGTLKREFETFLNSKAQREIAVQAAVKAGYSDNWIKNLEEGRIADGDVAALAVGALIRANK
jgi:N-acetylmuramoyl-L-alanine amidase